MNTMKKDELVKEKIDLEMALSRHMIRFFTPFCNIMAGVARYNYLEEEIRKVTPRPQEAKKDKESDGPLSLVDNGEVTHA